MDLIIGAGQVGRSLQKVLDCEIRDKEVPKNYDKVDVLHIAFSFTVAFKASVLEYISSYDPDLTVIHSTVPIGTTRAIRQAAERAVVHSPVMGKHPDLSKHIRKFKKFVGAMGSMEARATVAVLRTAKLKAVWIGTPEATELAKIASTTYYGLCIAYHQEMQRMCKKAGVPFQVITEWNKAYNQGYDMWDNKKYQRPILTPGFIGGHCVMPNVELLREFYSSPAFNFIEDSNKQWGEETGLFDNEKIEKCEIKS